MNDGDQPALVVTDLKHGVSSGSVGVMGPANGTAYFSNFRYRIDDDLVFEEPPTVTTPPGVITEWEISRPFAANQLDRENYPDFFAIFNAGWRDIRSEPPGLVNVSRHVARSGEGADCILARTIVQSGWKREIKLSFGYSDDVTLFLNGKRVFSGRSGYRSRDPSYVGIVGLNDDVYLTLQKGRNEILLILAESMGGWGVPVQGGSGAGQTRQGSRATREGVGNAGRVQGARVRALRSQEEYPLREQL